MLLDEGADMNARSNDGKTALSWAAMGKHNETVKILLTRGAKDKLQKKVDKTAPVLAEEGYKNVHLFKKIKTVD
jgi:ankyrin repeat protein